MIEIVKVHKKPYERHRCTAKTRAGERCRNWAYHQGPYADEPVCAKHPAKFCFVNIQTSRGLITYQRFNVPFDEVTHEDVRRRATSTTKARPMRIIGWALARRAE